VLAIAHTESGFNPDAAAGTTSASGLGQFVDKTGEAYSLNDNNRWDVNAQADSLVMLPPTEN
jgi:putative chitinase